MVFSTFPGPPQQQEWFPGRQQGLTLVGTLPGVAVRTEATLLDECISTNTPHPLLGMEFPNSQLLWFLL